jgi:hypothetical protein
LLQHQVRVNEGIPELQEASQERTGDRVREVAHQARSPLDDALQIDPQGVGVDEIDIRWQCGAQSLDQARIDLDRGDVPGVPREWEGQCSCPGSDLDEVIRGVRCDEPKQLFD